MINIAQKCIQLLICPVCGESLASHGRSLRCPNNHTFDLAREGYVNLWLNKKRPKYPGDSKEMLQARRRFLDAGYYQPIAEALNNRVAVYLDGYTQNKAVVLDVGCGEGYYLGQLATAVAHHNIDFCFFGMDSSKKAARLAAKRHKTMQFLVADVKQRIPLTDGAVDILFNIFAPRNINAFRRVTHPGSQSLVVIPHPNHLHDLRHKFDLLQIEDNKRQHVISQMAPTFKLQNSEIVAFPIELTSATMHDLLQMMPSARHLTEEQQLPLSKRKLIASVHIEILHFLRV